jgi:hypothetical protein
VALPEVSDSTYVWIIGSVGEGLPETSDSTRGMTASEISGSAGGQ